MNGGGGAEEKGQKELHLQMKSKGGMGWVSAPVLDPSLAVPMPVWGMWVWLSNSEKGTRA